MTNTDKQIPKHDKDMTSELEKSIKSLRSTKSGAVVIDVFENGKGYSYGANKIEELIPTLLSLLSQQREQILSEVRGELIKVSKYNMGFSIGYDKAIEHILSLPSLQLTKVKNEDSVSSKERTVVDKERFLRQEIGKILVKNNLRTDQVVISELVALFEEQI